MMLIGIEPGQNNKMLSIFSDYIAKYGRMSENAARYKFWQILSAVEYCHNRGIVHRDLKVSWFRIDFMLFGPQIREVIHFLMYTLKN